MDNSEVQMKEYETLRQEILDHQRRREQLFLYTITAFGIVWGFILREILTETGSGIAFIIISFAPYFVILNFCLGNAIDSGHINGNEPKTTFYEHNYVNSMGPERCPFACGNGIRIQPAY